MKEAAKKNKTKKISKPKSAISETENLKALVDASLNLNHDISNSLTSIIGNIDLLLMKSPDLDSEIESKLRVVLKEAKRIEKILQTFRDATRDLQS